MKIRVQNKVVGLSGYTTDQSDIAYIVHFMYTQKVYIQKMSAIYLRSFTRTSLLATFN